MTQTIDWALYTEHAVGRGSGTYADVINRPLREVLAISGADPDQPFAGFALAAHTHDASALVSGTVPTARGGTGLSSPAAGGLLVTAGAGPMTLLAAPGAGQVVRSNGTAWTAAPLLTADVSDLATAATGITKVGTLAAGAIGAGFTPIIDTYLATIGTAGKVANSATTATAANTASAIVARDASGNFSAGVITASFTGALTGVASLATQLATPRAINGVNFDGSAPITIKASTTNALTFGAHLSGTSFDGSAAVTIATDATAVNTVSTIVARDASGNFAANVISASLSGNASTATLAANATNAANVTGAAQPTITSLGTLTTLAVAGVLTGGGGFTSAKGALAAQTGVFATAFTPSVAGRYSIAWTLEGFGSSNIYSGIAEVIYDGVAAYLVSLTVGSTTTAQLAGGAFQIKQSSGTPQTLNWTSVFIPF